MKKIGNVLWGIVLIVIGLILAGNILGITDINIFFSGWWTLFIIVPCFIGLFKEKEKTGNIIGLLIGITLLLCCQNILDFDSVWKLAFPTILIVIGATIIFKDTFNHKITDEIKKINAKDQNASEYCATFSGQDINFDGEELKNIKLDAIFGGLKCDLKNSIINEDSVINCSAIFGGVDIFVPSNVKVKIKSSSLFGGVSDSRKNKENLENAKTLYINASCIFGGVDIK